MPKKPKTTAKKTTLFEKTGMRKALSKGQQVKREVFDEAT
jgi:hypothetical protein